MKRKERMNYSNEQKLEYTRMMVENSYSNQQIQDISGGLLYRLFFAGSDNISLRGMVILLSLIHSIRYDISSVGSRLGNSVNRYWK